MRINGWQRLGVVASVAWVLIGPLYFSNRAIDYAREMAASSYKICNDAPSLSPEQCKRDYDSTYKMYADQYLGWTNLAIMAFGPIPFTWLLVYMVIWIVRWIKIGFKQHT
jgi:hypothetical protein